MTPRRYELTDFEWSIIAPLLPNKPRGVPRADDRRVLNGIYWRLRSGSPWADIPERYGPATTCYNRFVRWRKLGVWDRIFAAVSQAYEGDLLRDRLSFMRFAGLALYDAVPDAKTIWLFREQLVRAGAFERLFARFDAALAERGYLAMGGQIVDATIVEARRPRLTQAEKKVVKDGGIPEN